MTIRFFLNKRGISLSSRDYFITALSYMALGLFSSLIIGLIIQTAGNLLSIETFKEMGSFAMKPEISGAAIGVAIAYGLKAPPLILFSSVFVGAYGSLLGGPVGSYIAVLFATELGKIVQGLTRVDIIVVPFTTICIGFFIGKFIGVYVNEFMTWLGSIINWATTQQPIIMSMIVAVLMGWALTAPISSVAIAYMLGLDGLAAGAAVIGCSAQMVGFATISYRDNGLNGVIAQGIGTSMLQVANIIKNPLIIIPPTLAGLIVAPIAVALFELENNTAGAGMGTSGLVGQIMAFQVNNLKGISIGITSVQVFLFHILLPLVISYFIALFMRKRNWIKAGDMIIKYD